MFEQALGVNANQPAPLLGVWERINIGLFLGWVIVLAIALLVRARGKEAHTTVREALVTAERVSALPA